MLSCSNSRVGKNYQIAVGPANPKTKYPPIIPPPIADYEHWRGSKKYLLPNKMNYQNVEYIEGNDVYIQNTSPPYPNAKIEKEFVGLQNELIDEQERLKSIKDMNDPNKYLFTQNIQPNIHTRPEVMNPVNANLGISYTPQFEPIGVESNMDGITFVHYDENDPYNSFKNTALRNERIQQRHPQMTYLGDNDTTDKTMNEMKRNNMARNKLPYMDDFVGKRAQQAIYDQNRYLPPRYERNVNMKEPFSLQTLNDETMMNDSNRPARAPCTKNTKTDYWIYDRNIQPFDYAERQVIEPVNDSIGVNYDPNFMPVDIEVGPTGDDEVSGALWDPQLVRDSEHPNRLMENPKRTRWSAKMSPFEAASMYKNIDEMYVGNDEIYDPRLTGYGDETRSYLFPSLGQIRYYYSDIDAYRRPNYLIRSDVDHMLFQDPMGSIKPLYYRNVLQENVRDLTNQKYIQDDLFHREDISNLQMRKSNQRNWAYRMGPFNKNAKTIR